MTPSNSLPWHFLLLLAALLLGGCAGAPEPVAPQTPVAAVGTEQRIEDLLLEAARRNPGEQGGLLLEAIELMLESGDYGRARSTAERIDRIDDQDPALAARFLLVRAELALAGDDPATASALLNELDGAGSIEQNQDLLQRSLALQARAFVAMDQPAQAALALVRLNTARGSIADQSIQDLLWQNLQRLDDQELGTLANGSATYEMRGWIELSRALRREPFSLPAQMEAARRWRAVWNRHSAAGLPPRAVSDLEAVWQARPQHVALLLPLQDQIGVAVQEGFLAAYYEAVARDEPVPRISVFDTSGVDEIRGLYERVVSSGADLVIGPINKELVRQLDNLANLPVPTLALNYTDSGTGNSAGLFQFGLAPEDEIDEISNLAWLAGYRNAAVVTPTGPDYVRLEQEFDSAWRERGGDVIDRIVYGSETELALTVKRLLAIDASEDRASRIESLLPRASLEFTPRRRRDLDFIFLIANPRQGRQIKPTLAFYFAAELPVYALPAIYDGSSNALANQDLDGVIFIDTPWLLRSDDSLRRQVLQDLRATQAPLQRLRALGVDSFRIHARLGQMAGGDVVDFPGVTGRLSMGEAGIIRRIPQSAVFADGLAIPFKPDPLARLD